MLLAIALQVGSSHKIALLPAKVVLTCRTEHFPDAKEGRALLNAELQASTKQLTGETPQFEVLELEKFNDEQIRLVLSYQTEATTVEQIMGNTQLLDLARRPVMTELILEALPDIEAGKPVDMSRVYLYAVRRKMERDIKSDRTFTSLAEKLYFLCELSWEMLSTDQMSLNYRLFPDRIRRLFGSVVQEEKDLDHWHYDMMGQTMLIRNADGDYTPAHRSLLEFFVAYKFAAELGALSNDFTELARVRFQINHHAAPVDYSWSAYFSRQVDAAGEILPTPALKGFISESLEKLRVTFGQAPLTKAVMDLLVGMIDVEAKESVIKIIEETRGKSEDEVGYVGGNAATVLVKIDKFALDGIVSVDFSHDSNKVASSSHDATIRLWDTRTGKCLTILQGHTNWVQSVALDRDGEILASGSADTTVRLWNFRTGECLNILRGHSDWVQSIVFCPNAQILASGSVDGSVRLWDVKLGECWKTFEDNYSIRSVAFSPDGETLAISNSGGKIKLWNIYTSQCLKILEVGSGPWTRSIAFSSDGKLLASGTLNESIGLWCSYTGKCWKTLQGHTKSVSAVAFSPDGKTLASGADDETVILWDINSGKCLKILQGHSLWIRSVAFSLDSKMLASCSCDGTIMLWETSTGNCVRTIRPKRPYEDMNITGVRGLTEPKKATLKVLGAMEDGE